MKEKLAAAVTTIVLSMVIIFMAPKVVDAYYNYADDAYTQAYIDAGIAAWDGDELVLIIGSQVYCKNANGIPITGALMYKSDGIFYVRVGENNGHCKKIYPRLEFQQMLKNKGKENE